MAQDGSNVLLVLNQSDSLSRRIGDYYVHARSIPLKNVCRLNVTSEETIPADIYDRQVEQPIAKCLQERHLVEQILYLVTTMGVPLRVSGAGSGPTQEVASVDSELTLLYAKAKGQQFRRAGPLRNPFFGQMSDKFRHPQYRMYLVTRLAAYDFADRWAAEHGGEPSR